MKLSKSFMKIEVYYIHPSYLSQCIIFKQPSKLVKHKLPCKNQVWNTANTFRSFYSVTNISQLSLQSIPNTRGYCFLPFRSLELLNSWLASDSKGLHGCHLYTHTNLFLSLIGLSNHEPLKEALLLFSLFTLKQQFIKCMFQDFKSTLYNF